MGSAKKTISYRYDANRNRTLMIDPDGGRTTYAYDALNRISSLINPQGERTTYAYDPKGRRTVKKLANGTRASFTYDAANRITTLANLKSDNSVISKFDYKYDNVGNRTEVAEADGSRVTWSYDNTYQLTAEHRTGTVPYRNTFTYDSVGNRLLKNESGARTTYSYDAANQLEISIDANGTTTYTYDADGNQELVQAPNNDRTTTTWNYENKTTLVELPSGIRNTMSYEPDGLRVKLEESTGTKKFIWDDQNYLAESDENDDINVVYTNEPRFYGNLVSQYRNSGAVWTPSYYHYEALGSTRQLTDDAEAITDTYLYDAWGNVINSSGSTENPFQFTGNVGYYFDVGTGNQYIRARIYRPTIGRWLSVDPLGFVDGSNKFVFVNKNLISSIDPSGTLIVRAVFEDPNPLENATCPGRVSIRWDFIPQSKNGKLGAPCDGFIVQKIDTWCSKRDCTDCKNQIPENTQPDFSFWEAWFVKKGEKFDEERLLDEEKKFDFTDSSSASILKDACGYKKSTGEIRFYCMSDIDQDLRQTWKPEGGYNYFGGPDASCITAVELASTDDIQKAAFWLNKKPKDGPEKRLFSLLYNCCPCEESKPTINASPRLR